MDEEQRRAALLVPPGEDATQWMHRHHAVAEAYELTVVTFAWNWADLMTTLWRTGGADLGVVGTRAEVDESRLIIAEEARQPRPPIPGQRRAQWIHRLRRE